MTTPFMLPTRFFLCRCLSLEMSVAPSRTKCSIARTTQNARRRENSQDEDPTSNVFDLPLIHHSLRLISWKSVLRVPLCAFSRWCLEAVVRVIVNPVKSVVSCQVRVLKEVGS